MLRVLADDDARAELGLGLDEICKEGARRMLGAALEAEVDAYVASLTDELDENGHRLVVRNGHARRRTITTGAGSIEVEAPRVNDKRRDAETGERQKFTSSIIAPWCRKSPKVSEVLPLMYLHGMSSGDFAPALGEFFGSAAGLSPSVVTRLTTAWQNEQKRFMERSLAEVDYVYVFADGVHFNVRLEEERLCCLVIVGVRVDGQKELVAIQDGYRESTDSWADLLRDAKTLSRSGITDTEHGAHGAQMVGGHGGPGEVPGPAAGRRPLPLLATLESIGNCGGRMQEEGWYVDPFGHHEARWISDGSPTSLVRDGQIESHDPPPEAEYSGTLQALPVDSRSDGSDLRRADESESSVSLRDASSLINVFDKTGWPIAR